MNNRQIRGILGLIIGHALLVSGSAIFGIIVIVSSIHDLSTADKSTTSDLSQ